MIRMYGVSFYVLCNLVDVEGHVRTVAVWRKQIGVCTSTQRCTILLANINESSNV